MNLIELENLVKGAPDEYLTKEVKQPTGKIPPFLALSEIQRRKDMRDRYQAQKNEGAKPTIADQLTGGIGSLGGAEAPQGAPVPTPSATGVPSAGAPPVATGGAPMPTPPGQPQGFARGGIVGYADGGSVTPRGSEVQRRNPSGYSFLEAFQRQSPEYYDAVKSVVDIPLGAYHQANNMLNATGDAIVNFIPAGQEGYTPLYLSDEHAALDVKMKEKAIKAEMLAAAQDAPAGPLPDYLRRGDAPVAPPSVPPAPSGVSGGYTATRGGIGSIDPNQALAGPSGSAPAIPSAPSPKLPNPYNVSAEELAYQEYLKNDENFKLPEALSYQGFIDEAVGEEQAIRAEAKKQALGAALVQLGAGLAAGDMAKGLTTAGAESRNILSEGRRDASAQKALAQQFKLKGMEGERDVKLMQREMDLKRTEGLATLVGGNRRDAEARAMEIARRQQDAAQHAASIGIQAQQLGLSRERAELEKKQGAVQFMESLIDTSVGKPPSQAEIDQWKLASRINPASAGPNPMDGYMAQRAAAAKLAAPKVEEVYGISAKNLYIDAVKPVSNPGTTMQIGRFKVQAN